MTPMNIHYLSKSNDHWEKVSMFFIEASKLKSKYIVDTPRITKKIVNNQKVVE